MLFQCTGDVVVCHVSVEIAPRICVRERLIFSRPCVSSSESFTTRSIPIAISSALPNVDLASERSLF